MPTAHTPSKGWPVDRPPVTTYRTCLSGRVKYGSMSSSEMTNDAASLVEQLPKHKVKIKKPGQRACNEKNDKGKICGGHLKRWFYSADVLERECGCIEKAWGRDAEVYRCEICHTLYLPSPADARGMNVAGPGQFSRFGFITPAKKVDDKDDKKTK